MAYANTAYFTKFSCGAELLLRNKLSGWVGGWVAGFCETITNSAQLELELGLSLAKSVLDRNC